MVSHQPSALTAAPTDQTGAGITLGTVSYMSPEQVTGDPLDGRSDIFSFGVVLYECVTGHQPFKGKTSGLILSEILNRTPPPPLQFNPDLPLRLQEIITNCLEKDRELRYHDAAALRTDLRRLKRDLESGPRVASRIDIPIETASSVTQKIAVTMPSTPSQRPPRKAKLLAAAIAAVVVVSTAAGVAVFRSSSAHSVDATPASPTAPPTAKTEEEAARPPAARAEAPAGERAQVPPRPSSPIAAGRQTAAPTRTAVEATTPPAQAATQTAAVPTPPLSPIGVPVAPAPPDLPKPVPAPAPAVSAAASTPVPSAPAEDDDASIRRVVGAYARAIEAKDLDAFRSVKPNLSAAEQRRLEESFRSVASQKVDISVLSIERHGSSAAVKVRRRDTLTAGGRSQTSESQQTMTLIRSGAGWVIREIGR